MNTMKAFTVSVTPEPLKETVRVEVPRAIVYDKFNGVLKLDGTHPHIERIRELVGENLSITVDNDPDGMKRDALYNEVKSLTSAAEAAALSLYAADVYRAKCDAEDKTAAEKWLSELEAQEADGLEVEECPGWTEGASGVVCQVFKISKEEMEKRNAHDPLYVALNRVFYYGYTCGRKNRRKNRKGATV